MKVSFYKIYARIPPRHPSLLLQLRLFQTRLTEAEQVTWKIHCLTGRAGALKEKCLFQMERWMSEQMNPLIVNEREHVITSGVPVVWCWLVSQFHHYHLLIMCKDKTGRIYIFSFCYISGHILLTSSTVSTEQPRIAFMEPHFMNEDGEY